MVRRSIPVLALATLAPMLAAKAVIANPYQVGMAASARSASTKTCATNLGTNLYSCNLISETVGPFHDCFQFSPGSGGEQEDVSSPLGFGPLACDCNPTGSTTKPKFDASTSAFTCEGTSSGSNTAFVGKVTAKGKKIVNGIIQIDGGSSYVLSCVVDPSCVP